MRRRDFMKGTGVIALSLPSVLSGRSYGEDRPNIIFIMADDMGYGDATCYNPDSLIKTPNIDKLASDGILFTDAHSPSAVCTPTRYGVLTGRYGWRSRLKRGVFGGYDRPLIEKNRVTVASFLKAHGYATASIGKWHLGLNWATKDGSQPDWGGDYEHANADSRTVFVIPSAMLRADSSPSARDDRLCTVREFPELVLPVPDGVQLVDLQQVDLHVAASGG